MAAVVGRDRELEQIAAFVDGAGPRVLALRGDAGIGKTTLWRAAVGQASERGRRVLTCAPTEAETQLAFACVRDLLEDSFDDVAHALPEPQRRALEVALLRIAPDEVRPEPGVFATAVLNALRTLGTGGPVLIAVDDAQWMDVASRDALRYALRRLAEEPILAMIAIRADADDPLEIERLDDARVETIELGVLSVGALGRLLRDRLDVTYPRPTLQRIHETSGGNAFYALELARALGPAKTPLPAGAQLPVPRTLRQLVAERVSALPRETMEALAFAAALSRPTVALLADALDRNPVPSLAPAIDANVVDVDGSAVRFAHPLFATAVYASTALRRNEIHERLAEIVADVEERALHIALSTEERSAAVAAVVEAGASAAFARGSPRTAAQLASNAVALTPVDAPRDALRRALEEVDYQFAAGDTVRATALVTALLEQHPTGPARAELLSRQARLQHFRSSVGASVDLLYRALGEAGDSSLRGEIEEGLAWGLLLRRRDLAKAVEHARSAAALAANDAALAEALAVQAVAELVVGRDWRPTMERALGLEGATRSLRVLRHPSFAYGYCLSCADELDRARTVFEELLRRADDAGDDGSVPSILNHLTLVEIHAGNWRDADAYADECLQRALESEQEPTQTSIRGKKALLAAYRGDLDAARVHAHAAVGTDVDPRQPDALMARGGETAVSALGFAALSSGDAAGADRYLGPMTHGLLAAGVREPGEVRSLPTQVEALATLGRTDEAEQLLSELESWAERVERPSVRGIAARCRGIVDASVEQLERAAEWHAGAPLPFERGRTLLALGSQQRRLRQRRAARETLQEALAVFEALGAELMAERVRDELGRIGGRAPSGELTETERRVAELVAAGRQNKEVAAELVVSVHTVEATLTRIYQKLEVRSRTELAARLSKT